MADDGDGVGPDLIYLPERPFDEEKFLDDVKKLLEKKSGIVVVASEGLRDKDGKPIVEPIFQVGRATYFGDVSQHLANRHPSVFSSSHSAAVRRHCHTSAL